MINSVRNSLFRSLNRLVEASSRTKFGVMDPTSEEHVQQERLAQQKRQEERAAYLDNTLAVYKQGKSAMDQQKIDVYATYLKESLAGHQTQDVLAQLDKIELVHRLQQIEDIIQDQGDFNLEHLQYEQLKAQAMLGDAKAQASFEEYYKNRPFVRPYTSWTDADEKLKHGLFQ